MTRFSRLLFVSLPLFVAACGNTDDGAPPNAEDGVLDVRVAEPAADPNYIDFAGSEMLIPPGVERITCTHLRYDGEETAFSRADALQGIFGHHAILVTPKTPLEPGTVEDCTAGEDMAKFEAFTITGYEVDGDRGFYLPTGKPLVVQSHYVNAGSRPILTRDLVRIKKTPLAPVKNWVSVYATNKVSFEVPSHQSASTSFDCVIPQDLKLLLVGGHLHEWGTRFETFIGPNVDSLESVYLVDPWNPAYRDGPPITLFFENPMPLPQGTILRTSCTWMNNTEQNLGFPSEMCATFGFVEGTKDPLACNVEN
jgi:hypothetical protein